jgi:hypothetical protein
MADNYVEPSAPSYAWDDPANSYAPNSYTAGLTQQQLEALWSKGQDYQAVGHAWDDPTGATTWGKYVDLGGDGKELQLLRNPDGSIYAVPKLNHGWNAAFAELALPIITAGAAAAYGVAGAGAGAAGEAGGLSGMDLAADAGAAGGNSIYQAAGQFATPGGVSGMDLAADGAASGGNAVGYYGGGAGTAGVGAAGGGGGAGGAGTSSIGESAYGWNPEGYTGGTPSLAGGGFGGAGNVGGGMGNGFLGMGTGDWLQLGGSLLNGYLGNRAANNALEGQLQGVREGNALLKYMYDTTRTDNLPALQARNAGLSGYQNLLANPSKITSDPGYQFGLTQGTKALNSQAAARGGYYSGAQLKALDQYGQDYGQTKFDNALGRYGTLAGIGQPGTAQIGQAAQQYGQTASNNLVGAGNARGAASMAGSNAWQNALNSYLGYQQYKNLYGG